MRRWFVALVGAFAACAGQGAAAPLSAYGGLPSIESVDISPDGSTLAFTATNGEERRLVIKPVAGGTPKLFATGQAKVRRLDWVGSDQIVITTSQTGKPFELLGSRREWLLGFKLDLKAGTIEKLLSKPLAKSTTGTHFRDAGSEIWATLNTMAANPQVRTLDGTPWLFLSAVSFKDNHGLLTIVKVDPRNGRQEITEFGGPNTNAILLDASGQPVARTDWDAKAGRWGLKLHRPGGWTEARAMTARIDAPDLLGLGRDGQSVLIGEPGDDGTVLREVAFDGTVGDPLDVKAADTPIFDPVTRRLIGFYGLAGDEARYTFFDPHDQQVWTSVKAAFKGDPVRLESWSSDRSRIVVLVDTAREGPGYALVDLKTHRADWLGARYYNVGEGDIAKVTPVRFKAKDGLELTGYLTLPNGREAKGLPLVVLPHGGPQARDEPDFDWWSQGVASRGYAVLRVNFRGSEGFGPAFVEAGYGQWGRKMQTDLSDGVRYLAGQGVIDPRRVCIVGASYGGYAALAGAALDPGVYRCAAAVAGVSDLPRMLDDTGIVAERYWKRFWGVSKVSDPALEAISPARHAEAVSIPILLFHGKDDTVVPLEQSQIMADALKKAGKPVEFVIAPGEDHWLSRGVTRQQMLTATMAFVEKNNPPN